VTGKLLALKIDVDTWRGTREGVPRLLDILRRHQAKATFLFSLGPDHTGRAIKRVLRKGFLQKVSRTSVLEHYGLRTLMYGTLLPGPDIGRREAAVMQSVRAAGHEVGIHCWDHIRWIVWPGKAPLGRNGKCAGQPIASRKFSASRRAPTAPRAGR
jgi:peptidoglycan/xylan/chitin deacetylase (PgdA/CDA1 family)